MSKRGVDLLLAGDGDDLAHDDGGGSEAGDLGEGGLTVGVVVVVGNVVTEGLGGLVGEAGSSGDAAEHGC